MVRFLEVLGFDCGEPRTYSGDWIDRTIGLEDEPVEVVMARAPDGSDMFELVGFARHSPARRSRRRPRTVVGSGTSPPGSTTCAASSAACETPADYENTFLLCCVRGPEGLIVELALRLDRAPG